MSPESNPSPSNLPQAAPQPGQMQPFSVDTSQLSTVYANFCRVTGTPEELVLDFGLNTQMSPQPTRADQADASPCAEFLHRQAIARRAEHGAATARRRLRRAGD